jgi:hypothetical protein
MSLLETLLGLKVDAFSQKLSPPSPASPSTGEVGEAGYDGLKKTSISAASESGPKKEPACASVPPSTPIVSEGHFTLPRGVRLLRFEPKPPPVAIDVCSIVVDVGLFIRRELEELNARLHSPVQIRGGWGVFTILDRLCQAGVELALEPTLNKEPQPDSASTQKVSQGDFGTP